MVSQVEQSMQTQSKLDNPQVSHASALVAEQDAVQTLVAIRDACTSRGFANVDILLRVQADTQATLSMAEDTLESVRTERQKLQNKVIGLEIALATAEQKERSVSKALAAAIAHITSLQEKIAACTSLANVLSEQLSMPGIPKFIYDVLHPQTKSALRILGEK